jgi:hypothetical protein
MPVLFQDGVMINAPIDGLAITRDTIAPRLALLLATQAASRATVLRTAKTARWDPVPPSKETTAVMSKSPHSLNPKGGASWF